ncbi:MAG: hypothetical protein COA80_06380 [Leeuwenhoekiella sp.]|nr:MAG: hypothetical protein COA80_06380 [Leeuwenhoekiella sp.]
MKLLKIDFQNINSLRGEHHIDFTREPFLQNSLFAITGPTGSGKTTILDVISLALFNQVPRLGKMSTNEILKKGAILTRNQSEAFAKVTYRCKAGIFASTWSISTARTGNLRDYHMELEDLESGALLDLKKSDVPAKNEELIGLSYDQFIKSVVLAQGEFAKFLQVPKKERGALLEKITGTEIYRRIGQEVFLKNKERAAAIDAKKGKIETYKEQLLEEEVYKLKQTEGEKLQQEREAIKSKLERLAKEIDLKTKLRQEEAELAKTENELRELKVRQQEFDAEKGLKLKRHQEIQVYGDDLNTWQSLTEKVKDKQSEFTTASEAIKTAEAERNRLKHEISEVFKLDVSPEHFSKKLDAYKTDLRKLIAKRNTIATSFTNTKTHLKSLASPLHFDSDPSDSTAFEAEVRRNLNTKQKTYEELEVRFDLKNQAVSDKKEKLQQQLKQLRQAEKSATAIEHLKSVLQERQTEATQITAQQKGLPEQLNALKTQIELKEAQLEAKQHKLEIENLQKQLSDYRRELNDNEPCPLCGALHHPYAEDLPLAENGLKTAIDTLKQELNELSKKRSATEFSLNQLRNQEKQLLERLSRDTTQLKTEQEKFDKEFKELLKEVSAGSFKELENSLEEQERQLNQAENLHNELKLLHTLKSQAEDLNTLLKQGKQVSQEIEKRFTGKISEFEHTINSIETAWNRNEQNLQQQQQLLKAAEAIAKQVQEQLSKLSKKLTAALQQKGYDSIELALQQRLPAGEAQALAIEHQNLQNAMLRLNTLHAKLNEAIAGLKETAGEIPLEELKQQQLKQNEALTKNETAFNEVSRLLKNQKQNLEAIDQLQQEINTSIEESRHWYILNELIGDSKGDKFNNFAQDLTLQQLLLLANKRLIQLTDRYRIDQPGDEEDDSLVAIDEHMGGQRRSIKTLSGGETFILSLALALALSDLASRNIEINSLFIDEGFGTLDPETLDQTLDTLEVLQAESSKMIGVISHVDSLKERIATQIQLTQNGQGYSTLKVV